MMTSDSWKGYTIPGEYWYEGILCHDPFLTGSNIAAVRDFPVQDGDVFLASIAKAGSTWTKEIVWLILNNCDTAQAKSKSFTHRTPVLEYSIDGETGLELAAKMGGQRFLNSYLPMRLMPKTLFEKDSKIIYLIRNPKDVIVSMYHYYRMDELMGFYTGTFDDFYDLYLKEHIIYGTWFDHVSCGWEKRSDPRMMIVFYEDLKRDLRGNVLKLAKFLGKELSEENVNTIVEHCSLKSMRANPMVNGESHPTFDLTRSKFIRKGIIGDWKNHFTVAQNERFEEFYVKRMAGYDIPLQYE